MVRKAFHILTLHDLDKLLCVRLVIRFFKLCSHLTLELRQLSPEISSTCTPSELSSVSNAPGPSAIFGSTLERSGFVVSAAFVSASAASVVVSAAFFLCLCMF